MRKFLLVAFLMVLGLNANGHSKEQPGSIHNVVTSDEVILTDEQQRHTSQLVTRSSAQVAEASTIWYTADCKIVTDTISEKEYESLSAGACRQLTARNTVKGAVVDLQLRGCSVHVSVLFPEDKALECFATASGACCAKIMSANGKAAFLKFTIARGEWSYDGKVRAEHPDERGLLVRNGEFADIVEVGQETVYCYGDSDECDSFRLVRIKSSGKELLMDGRNVYGIYDSDQSWLGIVGGRNVAVKGARNYGIPYFYEDHLTFCASPALMVFIENGVEHAVELANPDISLSTAADERNYVRLEQSSESVRRVTNVTKCGEAYNVTVDAMFMEDLMEITYQVLPQANGPWKCHCKRVVFYGLGNSCAWFTW